MQYLKKIETWPFIPPHSVKKTHKNPKGRNYSDFTDTETGSKWLKYLLKFNGQANSKTKIPTDSKKS